MTNIEKNLYQAVLNYSKSFILESKEKSFSEYFWLKGFWTEVKMGENEQIVQVSKTMMVKIRSFWVNRGYWNMICDQEVSKMQSPWKLIKDFEIELE